MNDTEIVKAVALNLGLAAVLSRMGLQDAARLVAAYAVKLTTSNYAACQRWMESRPRLKE